MQSEENIVNDIHCHKIMEHKYASKMNISIAMILSGKSEPYKKRTIRVLNNFFEYCFVNNLRMKIGTDVSQCYSSWQEIHFSGIVKKSPLTLLSDTRSLWVALLRLCKPSINGLPETNHIAPPRRLNTLIFSDTDSSRAKVLGGFDLSMNTKGESLTLTLETDVDTFLGSLVSTMKKHRDVIYKISQSYLTDAQERYNLAQRATKSITACKFQNNPQLFHPKQTNTKGQPLSLFSNYLQNGECGKTNLLAYIAHCKNGIIDRDFPGGNNHLYRFTRNQYELREHFGLSTLSAVAACNIIITESGINVDSLRRLALSAQGSANHIFEPSQHGFRVSYHKPRAKEHLKRNLKHATSDPHIEKAFSYLVEVTSHHRSLSSGNTAKRLFLYQTNTAKDTVRPMSDLPFKSGFIRLLREARKLIQKDPNWCKNVTPECIDEVINASPTAKKLRATEGVIRWYDSGGNPAAAAKYLGNSEAVSIKNYLPKELQLALYNQRVRRFQNILICRATDGEKYQIQALNLKDEVELTKYLSRLDKRVPHWKSAIQTIANSGNPKSVVNDVKVTFDICPDNVAIMKACHVIEMKRFNSGAHVDDSIKEVSLVYQALSDYVNTHPDRRLKRTIQQGDRLYEKKAGSYSDLKITKQEVCSVSN
ncbi:hypothetical protein [Vibrio brasiliensis]|uniref:hypothetical protein n=1 Tax=Vibrio brasiliensis TaxID=170652 RepID=UPI001EFD1895|nr:hypothetical protein [Vibrio brasiliensis]MCG9727880.1 hypothetical protein [Vibrio brasiliensis]